MSAPERYKQAREQIAKGELVVEPEVYGDGTAALPGEVKIDVSGLRPDSRDKMGRRVKGNFKAKVGELLIASKERGEIVDKLIGIAEKGDKKVYFSIIAGAVMFGIGIYAEKRRGWKDIRLLNKLIKKYGKNPPNSLL